MLQLKLDVEEKKSQVANFTLIDVCLSKYSTSTTTNTALDIQTFAPTRVLVVRYWYGSVSFKYTKPVLAIKCFIITCRSNIISNHVVDCIKPQLNSEMDFLDILFFHNKLCDQLIRQLRDMYRTYLIYGRIATRPDLMAITKKQL